MTREEQIMNFVETKYKELALANPDGLTPEGRGYLVGLGDVIRFADKLPKTPVPQGLDEAAEEYANDEMMSGLAERAFKAGAKWMAERGWHEEAVIKGSNDIVWLNYNVELPIDLAKYFKDGDKVIVQVRKKEK